MRRDEFIAAKAAADADLAKDASAQAALAAEHASMKAMRLQVLEAEKANLKVLSEQLKGNGVKGKFAMAKHASQSLEGSSSKEAVLLETHPRQAGVRAARAFYVTPWDSNYMDGGSIEDLIVRYSSDMAKMDAEITSLRA